MKWPTLCEALFGAGHGVACEGEFLAGTGVLDGEAIAVIGTAQHAAIGFELALRLARAILDTVRDHPGRPILLLVDTQGQRLRRRDEQLGIHRAMAHLASTVDLARRRGHAVIGLVYDQALSGGFIGSGLAADRCYALPKAEIRVMRLPAMARVTKLPEAMLEALSRSNPVFAPGVDHYVAMGAITSLWRGDLRAALREALGEPAGRAMAAAEDRRALDGAARGGRRLAAQIAQRVLDAA